MKFKNIFPKFEEVKIDQKKNIDRSAKFFGILFIILGSILIILFGIFSLLRFFPDLFPILDLWFESSYARPPDVRSSYYFIALVEGILGFVVLIIGINLLRKK